MNDKISFRLIMIGFLSGIVFSGFVFLILHTLQINLLQKSIIQVTPITVSGIYENNYSQVNGRINLNRATLADLETLPGIGETKANAIIEFREKYGSFENISELSYVSGIGNTLLKSIQDLVIIN
jgi:competence protein ComEA